ncbi:hypothetical protein [Glaciihabitans sp. UYNi722]|uniref:hypothetical protein n=1 Tax=Glaciihabitans sp. UYNi722 TaxID=3156344 RepID=UPI0033961816
MTSSPVEGWWTLPNGGTADNVTWPQPAITEATQVCGTVSQVDTYPSQAALDALRADGFLTLVDGHPEDSGVVISWRFVTAPECGIPPVDPPVVVTPPVVTPPAIVLPVVTPPTAAAVITPNLVAAKTAPTVKALASTGTPETTVYWLAGGLALLLLGATVFTIARIREEK